MDGGFAARRQRTGSAYVADDAGRGAPHGVETALGPRRWAKHLSAGPDDDTIREFRRHEATGRSVGSERSLTRLEKIVGLAAPALVASSLRPQKPGRKKKNGGE